MRSIVVRVAVSGGLLFGLLAEAMANDATLVSGADPTIVATKDADGNQAYYVVATGRGIRFLYSPDLKSWKRMGRVFEESAPAWAKEEVSGADAVWAPDLSFHKGLFHLYYSVSTFGSQRSVIGLAVNKTLDQTSEDYEWVDRGKVIESFPGRCDFNAIDPALFVDEDGRWHLFFGSFWSGLKVIELVPETGKPGTDAEIVPVAARPRHRTHAIEAPFVIRRGEYYYLFVSWDRCCDGADSDYKIMVGRSRKVLGPYVDKDGRAMLDGGGTLVLKGNERWRGPGHNSVLTTDEGQWLVHHTYDMQNLQSHRILQIRPMTWTVEGWPKVGEPIVKP